MYALFIYEHEQMGTRCEFLKRSDSLDELRGIVANYNPNQPYNIVNTETKISVESGKTGGQAEAK